MRLCLIFVKSRVLGKGDDNDDDEDSEGDQEFNDDDD